MHVYPQKVLRDILILEDEIFFYQRKFSRLAGRISIPSSEAASPPTAEWLPVWTAWAGANKLLRNRWKQCRRPPQPRPLKHTL